MEDREIRDLHTKKMKLINGWNNTEDLLEKQKFQEQIDTISHKIEGEDDRTQ